MNETLTSNDQFGSWVNYLKIVWSLLNFPEVFHRDSPRGLPALPAPAARYLGRLGWIDMARRGPAARRSLREREPTERPTVLMWVALTEI